VTKQQVSKRRRVANKRHRKAHKRRKAQRKAAKATTTTRSPSVSEMERRAATNEVHEDDSYRACVSCRIIDLDGPLNADHDDVVVKTVPFPCAVARERATVECDDPDCGAYLEPRTLDEYRLACGLSRGLA